MIEQKIAGGYDLVSMFSDTENIEIHVGGTEAVDIIVDGTVENYSVYYEPAEPVEFLTDHPDKVDLYFSGF